MVGAPAQPRNGIAAWLSLVGLPDPILPRLTRGTNDNRYRTRAVRARHRRSPNPVGLRILLADPGQQPRNLRRLQMSETPVKYAILLERALAKPRIVAP